MGEQHLRVTLQDFVVLAGKTFAGLAGRQEGSGFLHQGVHGRRGERLLRIQQRIRVREQVRDRREPGEPGVAREQLQELVGGERVPETLLVAGALGIQQGLVQRLQDRAQFREALPETGRFRAGGKGIRHFHPGF